MGIVGRLGALLISLLFLTAGLSVIVQGATPAGEAEIEALIVTDIPVPSATAQPPALPHPAAGCTPPMLQFLPVPVDTGIDMAQGPEFDILEWRIPLEVPTEGNYRLWVTNNNLGQQIFVEPFLTAGFNMAIVQFHGFDIFASGTEGPWMFNFTIEDPITLERAYLDHMSQSWQLSAFTPVPPASGGGPATSLDVLDLVPGPPFEFLNHKMDLFVEVPGRYFIDAQLWDQTMTQMLTFAQYSIDLAAGPHIIDVPFVGAEIVFSGVDGPYFSQVNIMSPGWNPVVNDIGFSPPYLAAEFDFQFPGGIFVDVLNDTSGGIVAPGDEIPWFIEVQNFNAYPEDVSVRITIPATQTYLSDDADGHPGFVSRSFVGNELVINFTGLAAPGVVIRLVTQADGPFPTMTYDARISATHEPTYRGFWAEPQMAHDRVLVRDDGVVVTGSVDRSVIYPGEQLVYDLELLNTGCDGLENVVLRFQKSPYGTPSSIVPPPSGQDATYVYWNQSTLDVDGRITAQVTFDSFVWLWDGAWINSLVDVTYDIAPPQSGSIEPGPFQPGAGKGGYEFANTPTISTLVINPKGQLEPGASTSGPFPGSAFSYTINHNNTGNGTAAYENITLTLDSDVNFASSDPAPTAVSGDVLWYNLTGIAPGNYSLQVNVSVDIAAVVSSQLDMTFNRNYTNANLTTAYDNTTWFNLTVGTGQQVNANQTGLWHFSQATVNTGDVKDVMDDSDGDGLTDWDIAWQWDLSATSWLQYSDAKPAFLNDVLDSSPGLGFWLNITVVGDGYISIAGAQSGAALPFLVGWNSFGATSFSDAGVGSLPGCVSVAVDWNGTAYSVMPGAATLYSGVGYWGYATGACLWS